MEKYLTEGRHTAVLGARVCPARTGRGLVVGRGVRGGVRGAAEGVVPRGGGPGEGPGGAGEAIHRLQQIRGLMIWVGSNLEYQCYDI